MSNEISNQTVVMDDPPPGITWTLALISCIVTVWFLLVTSAMYYLSVSYERDGKVTSITYQDRLDIKFSQEVLIKNPPGWAEGTDAITGENYRRFVMPVEEVFDFMLEHKNKTKNIIKDGRLHE